MRKNTTDAEKVLWGNIRKRQIKGYKFRRQFSIGGFVVDFYCPRLKLAIEVDGSIHLGKGPKIYDKAREKLLNSLRIEFLRFANDDVFEKTKKVIRTIKDRVEELKVEREGTSSLSPPS